MKRAWFVEDSVYNDGVGLKQLIADLPKRCKLLEVGTLEAVGTMLFATRCSKVVTIDGYNLLEPYGWMTKDRLVEAEKRAKRRIKRHRKLKNKVKAIKGISPHIAKDFRNGEFDVIYIDGCHFYDEVKADILAWLPKIKKDGIICGGAYQIEFVAKAIKDVFGKDPDKLYQGGEWLIKL